MRPSAPELADAFPSEEVPTVALSKPVLDLLAQGTSSSEAETVRAMPIAQAIAEPAAEPTEPIPPAAGVLPPPSSSNARAESRRAVALQELEETQPRARRAAPLELGGARRRLRAHTLVGGVTARTMLAVAGFVVAASALGAASWLFVGRAKAPTERTTSAIPRTPAPSPSAGVLVVETKPEVASPAAAPEALSPEPVRAPEGAAVEPSALGAALLLVDGSEAKVPACAALLEGVPTDTDKKWGLHHVQAARKALVRGDVEGSQQAYCQAVRARPDEPTAAFELAQLLLLRRDGAAAAEWARRAATLEPNSPRVLALSGDAEIRAGNLGEARKAWLRSAKLDEDDGAGVARMVNGTFDAALLSLKERDPARAERLLRRVIAFQPEHAAAHAKMASALTQLGYPKSAELWAARARELSDN